jgi:hypothetical protein
MVKFSVHGHFHTELLDLFRDGVKDHSSFSGGEGDNGDAGLAGSSESGETGGKRGPAAKQPPQQGEAAAAGGRSSASSCFSCVRRRREQAQARAGKRDGGEPPRGGGPAALGACAQSLSLATVGGAGGDSRGGLGRRASAPESAGGGGGGGGGFDPSKSALRSARALDVGASLGALDLSLPSGELGGSSYVVRRGILVKQGQLNRNWQARYCVLEEGRLTYFEREGGRPKGTVFLLETTTCERADGHTGREGSLRILSADRIFYAQPEEPGDCDAWIEAVRQCIPDKGGVDAHLSGRGLARKEFGGGKK